MRRMKKGGQPRLVRHLLLPLGISLALVWIMFIGFPGSNDSSWPVMRVFLPDTTLIFAIGAVVILLTNFLRLGVYLRSRKESEGGAGRKKPENTGSDKRLDT